MTKTTAIKQATAESTMYRQGPGWVVSSYSAAYEANVLSAEMGHSVAREVLTNRRAVRALALLGFRSPEILVSGFAGSARDRVNQALRLTVREASLRVA